MTQQDNLQPLDEAEQRHIRQAVMWLKSVETKNGGLINGNFSKAAQIYHVRVRDLRAAWFAQADTNQSHERGDK